MKGWISLVGLGLFLCGCGELPDEQRAEPGVATQTEGLAGTSQYAFAIAVFYPPSNANDPVQWGVSLEANSSSPDAYKRPYDQPTSVTSAGPGMATVTFPGVGNSEAGGNVQVDGAGSARCKVTNWGSVGDVTVGVACFSPDGAPTNSPFDVSYYRETSSAAALGYVWADQPTTPFNTPYTPALYYQFNSTGQTNTITRTSFGAYAVFLPGLTTTGGTVDVTAYGSGNGYCKVANWTTTSSGTTVNVRCFGTFGAPLATFTLPTDSMFTLAYGRRTTHGGVSYAYSWSGGGIYQLDQIEAPSVAPHQASAPMQTLHKGTGVYELLIPDVGSPASAHVTAYGTGSEYCSGSVGFDDVPARPGRSLSVYCYNAAGSPVDTAYVATWADSAGGAWSPFTSDEFAPTNCVGNSAMQGVWCTGSYCDNVALQCQPFTWDETPWWATTRLDHSTDYFTPWFSEEGAGTTVTTCGSGCVSRQLNQGFCSGSDVVTGLSCSGSYCDNVRLRCTKLVGTTLYASQCRWTGWISEEQNDVAFSTGYYVHGAECSGSYCDNMRFYVCPLY